MTGTIIQSNQYLIISISVYWFPSTSQIFYFEGWGRGRLEADWDDLTERTCGCWDKDGMMFSRVSLPCGHQNLVKSGSSSTWRWGRGIKRSVRVNRVIIWVVSLVERCELPLQAYSQGKRKDTFWKIGINIPGFELTNATPHYGPEWQISGWVVPPPPGVKIFKNFPPKLNH